MNDPHDDEFDDELFPDIDESGDGYDVDDPDDDSLYLDEADRGAVRRRRETTDRARARASDPKSMFDHPTRGEPRRATGRRPLEAARQLAMQDARRRRRSLRAAALRALRSTALSPRRRERVLGHLLRRFVLCAAAQVTPGSAALSTSDGTFRIGYRAVLHRTFRGLADQGYLAPEEAESLADTLVATLGWGEISLRLGSGTARVDENSEVFDPEGELESVDDGADAEDAPDEFAELDEFADAVVSSVEPSGASAAQIRACSRSLRLAARHLLRIERQLGFATRSPR